MLRPARGGNIQMQIAWPQSQPEQRDQMADGVALMAVLDKPGISSSLAVAAVQSATGISSDGDKARVLLDAADRYSGIPAVNAALRKAVESLHSDGDYRTVMSRIGRHEASL